MNASSEGVCVWGGAETPLQAGSRAEEAAGAAWSLKGHENLDSTSTRETNDQYCFGKFKLSPSGKLTGLV